MDEPPPPILDYRSAASRKPATSNPAKIGWLSRINRGEDSFLACSALFFALAGWATTILGVTFDAGPFSCLSISVMGVSFVLCLAALLESRTSKTFPLAGLLINVAFGIWILFRLGRL